MDDKQNLLNEISSLKDKVSIMESQKMDDKRATKLFKEVKDSIKKSQYTGENLRNDLMTLENYVERYLPMNMSKIIRRLLVPILEKEDLMKLDKIMKAIDFETSQNIL